MRELRGAGLFALVILLSGYNTTADKVNMRTERIASILYTFVTLQRQ